MQHQKPESLTKVGSRSSTHDSRLDNKHLKAPLHTSSHKINSPKKQSHFSFGHAKQTKASPLVIFSKARQLQRLASISNKFSTHQRTLKPISVSIINPACFTSIHARHREHFQFKLNADCNRESSHKLFSSYVLLTPTRGFAFSVCVGVYKSPLALAVSKPSCSIERLLSSRKAKHCKPQTKRIPSAK